MSKAKHCTVITDASHCGRTKSAGWAAWLTHNIPGEHEPVRKKFYASFSDVVENSFHAECMAIINAAKLAKIHCPAPHYHFVTDCIQAIKALKVMKRKKNKYQHYAIMLRDILGDSTMEFKHVKAHSNIQDSRSWVNRWCDKYAKKSMREMREKLEEAATQ